MVPRGTPADELNACLESSALWHHVRTLHLTTNMRVKMQNVGSVSEFSNHLLDLENGKIPIDPTTSTIKFPPNLCTLTKSTDELFNGVFF